MPIEIMKKPSVTRAAHYFFLLPFLPGLRPLLVNYRTADMVIYLAGVTLITAVVIYGNHRPLVQIERTRLALYLNYRHDPEYHPFREITGYSRRSSGRITLYSRGQRPVNLHLRKADLDRLINRLNIENIHAV